MARCVEKKADGERCTRDAIKGAKRCRQHRDLHSRRNESRTRSTRVRDWRPAFLTAFAKHGLVIDAAKEAGIGRTTVYEERQRNEDFALRWAEIEEWTTEEMEQEARRRAVLGVEEPVFHKGEQCGTIRRYSDTLLQFMLRARKPEVYRERVAIHHSGELRTEAPEVPESADRLAFVASVAADIGVLPTTGEAE